MEKRCNNQLEQTFTQNGFDMSNFYYSVKEEKTGILEKLLEHASKTGSKNGIPDGLYLEDNILIVCECKSHNIQLAINDTVHYIECINKNLHALQVYGIAYVSNDNYSILNNKGCIVPNILIKPESFNLKGKKSDNITIHDMEKIIHDIHNYIRNNTKISDEDKPYFISCILIFFKSNVMRELIKNIHTMDNIYSLIEQTLIHYNLDFTVFQFLKNDNNNIHLQILILKIAKIYEYDTDIDILNLFYHEFVKYNNSNSKSLGIVLTPDHIVKLMVKLLDIQPTDIVLDLCTGTGTFLLESYKYNPSKIIGIEYQKKLFSLLKCNFILRDINTDNYELKNIDCFVENYQCNKSIINPPYSTKPHTEIDFMIKQLDSMTEGGIAVCILPIGKLSDDKQRNLLLSKCKVNSIITCNLNTFYPTAGVHCLIISVTKCNQGHDYTKDVVDFIDYTNDGLTIVKHSGQVKTKHFDSIFDTILNEPFRSLISPTKQWWFYHKKTNINLKTLILEIKTRRIDTERMKQLSIIRNNIIDIPIKYVNNKDMKVTDLFNIISSKKSIHKQYVDENPGVYPYISASKLNNGESGYISTYEYDYTSRYCITLSTNGSIGYAYIRSDKFSISSDVYILEPKITMSIETLEYICILFKLMGERYSFGRKLKRVSLSYETLKLPINDDNSINEMYIHELNN